VKRTFGFDRVYAESVAFQAQVAFYLAFLTIAGPLTLLVSWWLSRRRLAWWWRTLLSLGAAIWLVILWQGAGAWPGTLMSKVFWWWGGMSLASPLGATLFIGWRQIMSFLRPRNLQEHLDEQEALLAHKNQALSRQAKTQAEEAAPTLPEELNLGVFIKGDRFPEHIGIRREGNWVLCRNSILSQHLLLIGSTGAGKSETIKRLIAETLTHTERDIFFIDGKGDKTLAAEVAQMVFAARGQQVPVLTLGLDEASPSLYNGFVGQPTDLYNRFSALLRLDESDGAARYYADINRDLIQLACYAPGGPPRSFAEVVERVDKKWLERAYRDDPQELYSIRNLTEEHLTGLLVRLRPIMRELANLVRPEGFILEKERGAIFSLRTQSVGDTARHFLDFLIEDVKDFVGKRQKRPGLLIIDEFGAFGNKNILALLSMARSADMGVILATQDIASLGEEDDRRLIMANTRTKILMATDFPEEVAQLAGTMYGIEASIQHQDGEATGAGSARVQHQFRVDMNETARLKGGEAFIIRQRYAAKLRVKRVEALTVDPEAIARHERQEKPAPARPKKSAIPPLKL